MRSKPPVTDVQHVHAATPATRARLRQWHLAIAGFGALFLARTAFVLFREGPEAGDFGGLGGLVLVTLIAVAVFGAYALWASIRSRRHARSSTAPYVRVSALQLSQLASSSILADAVARVNWQRLDASAALGVNGVLAISDAGITWTPVRGSRRLGADAWQLPWSGVRSAELTRRYLFLTLVDGATLRLGARPKLVAPLLVQFGVPGAVGGPVYA
jgi:hypothetical protein